MSLPDAITGTCGRAPCVVPRDMVTGRIQWIANFVIVIAITVLAITLLDVFLGEARKARLTDIGLRVWYWLAKAKDHSLLDWLRKHVGILYLLAVVVQFWYLYWLYFHTKMLQYANSLDVHGGPFPSAVLIFFSFLLSIVIGNWRAYHTLQAPTLPRALIRLSLLLGLFIILLSALGGLSFVVSDESFSTAPGNFFTFSIVYPEFILFFLTLNFTVILLVCWTIVALPLLIVTACSVCFITLEFIIRRLVEYPKGPLLALTTIFGTIAVLFKAIG